MKDNRKRALLGIVLLAAFVLWTILIQHIDVQKAGPSGVIIANFNKPVWNRHRLITGVVLSILAVIVFIATRQPYAGIICFAFLVIKGFLIIKVKQQ